MANILINGVNTKTGGGKSILNNYLSLLTISTKNEHKYFLLCPEEDEYSKYENDFLSIIYIPKIYKLSFLFPLLYFWLIPKITIKNNIDVIFNHGDVPIPTKSKQVFLFDWPYAAYPKSIVWKMMDFKSWFIRKFKLYMFKNKIHFPSKIIAQTPTMKKKLEHNYGLNNISIVPNAVSLDNFSGGEFKDFNFPHDKIKLLYLTYYYPHKNLEIFIPLAKKIKDSNLPFLIVITIDKEQHKKAKKFLQTIEDNNLKDIIVNIGPVKMINVPSIYQQCDALLMPTLLESFSGTYIEAMYHKLPIFTSNFDFAIDVCGKAAFYFNPLNSNSILEQLTKVLLKNEGLKEEAIQFGTQRLNELINWEEAFNNYQDLLNNEIK